MGACTHLEVAHFLLAGNSHEELLRKTRSVCAHDVFSPSTSSGVDHGALGALAKDNISSVNNECGVKDALNDDEEHNGAPVGSNLSIPHICNVEGANNCGHNKCCLLIVDKVSPTNRQE